MGDYFFDINEFNRMRKSMETPSFLWGKTKPRNDFFYKDNNSKTDISFDVVDSPLPSLSLEEALINRKSSLLNTFTGNMSKNEVLKYLNSAFNTTGKKLIGDNIEIKRKPYPTAGGLNTIQPYVFINNVDGLSTGLYQVNENGITYKKRISYLDLETISPLTFFKNDSRNNTFKNVNLIVILIAKYNNIFSKYGFLSYKLLYLEAGHIAQNLQLLSSVMNLRSLPLGGCFNDKIEKIVPETEFEYLYSMAVG
jgi:raw score 2.93